MVGYNFVQFVGVKHSSEDFPQYGVLSFNGMLHPYLVRQVKVWLRRMKSKVKTFDLLTIKLDSFA